jgi:hypothetical protein
MSSLKRERKVTLGDTPRKDTINYHGKVYKTWELPKGGKDGGSFLVAETALRREVFGRRDEPVDEEGADIAGQIDCYATVDDTLEVVYERAGCSVVGQEESIDLI